MTKDAPFQIGDCRCSIPERAVQATLIEHYAEIHGVDISGARLLECDPIPSGSTKGDEVKIGSIVHYVSYGTPGGEYQSECRAAIVTKVYGYAYLVVDIAVLNPTGLFFDQQKMHHDPSSTTESKGGTWHTLEECTGSSA